MTSPYRIACLVSHPIQYQAPMFRYLAASPEIDLTVLFLSDLSVREYHDPGFGVAFKWDVPLIEGYRSEFLPAFGAIDEISFWRPFTRRIRRRLREGRFDALWVHGYAHQAMLRAVAAARSLGIKVLMRGDSNIADGARSPARRALKARILPRLFSAIDGFLAVGTRNREYYLAYGVPEAKIFSMPYAVDNEFFRSHAEAARPRREQLRCELGLATGRPIILFASKFQPRKRARDLIEACAAIGAPPHPYLLMVGDGEERAALEARTRELGLGGAVRFLGFRNQTELPRLYDLCDVFVLPSNAEPWGLILNEVMNAAKPVIASDAVGAAPDLVIDGANGFVYPAGDIGALARALERVTRSPEHAAAMGAKSLEIVSRYSFAADRAGLLAAIAAVTGRAAEN
ncbi:MAG TPA: glycosyltransferase family 4 protein [Candidatus Binataceae bacterium]|nr:glycosyltransferase family 4 protein [Candidatus Binataceae bacterium]